MTAELPDPEVEYLDQNEEVPPRGDLLNGVDLVRAAIASLNGGVNGANPYVVLGISEQSDGTLQYTLTDRETGETQNFVVSITPAE